MTLQEQLLALRMQRAPIPLVGIQAVKQALALRREGLSYGSIAIVMHVYHGSTRSEHSWRRQLRAQGAAPKHHGDSCQRLAPHERAR